MLFEARRAKKRKLLQSKKILLVQLRQLGDILLTTPCIRELKLAMPHAKVSFFSHQMGHSILQRNPYLDSVFIYHDSMSLRDQFSLFLRMRKENFDLIVDFMANPRSALWTSLLGAKWSLSFKTRRRFFYHECIPANVNHKYIVEEKFDLLRRIGIQPRDAQTMFPLVSTDKMKWSDFCNQQLSALDRSKRKVLISPTHRRAQRRWPLENYAKLADWLTDKANFTVIIGWGPGEKTVAQRVQSLACHTTYLAPETNLQELAAMLSEVDLFIGNSNGPSHLAVAGHTPSFQIHGPTDLISWSPMEGLHSGIQSQSGDISEISFKSVVQKLLPFLTYLDLNFR